MKSDDKLEKDEFTQEVVDNLNKNVGESVARGERYEKIYAIERTKWPHGMGSIKDRYEIPENLQAELDECITKSQVIARDACQTEELTNAYLAENSR
jgi:thymidine phosphorylase